MMSSVRQWWIVLLALLLAGTGRAEDLVIPGSGNPEYVLDQLSKAFNARQTQHRVAIPPSTGTAGALRDVGEGISSVGVSDGSSRTKNADRASILFPSGATRWSSSVALA